jgi:hypothetical protein
LHFGCELGLCFTVSYPAWKRIFGGDHGVVGQQVVLDQRAATVMPRGFSSPGGVDLWHTAQFVPGNWGSYRGGNSIRCGCG